MTAPDVAPGTVTVFTDVMCGWSTIALHRFYRARTDAGLDGRLTVDLQLFLLEDVNRIPLNWRIIEPEKPVVGALEPELEFTTWQRDLSKWPVTSLPANEAVHAAKEQSPAAAEQLDMALRLAFWRDSRCISMRHEILDVADGCDRVDVDRLREAVDSGRARGPMLRTYLDRRDAVQGSPHFFLADGSDTHNPGISLHLRPQPGRVRRDPRGGRRAGPGRRHRRLGRRRPARPAGHADPAGQPGGVRRAGPAGPGRGPGPVRRRAGRRRRR